MNAKGFQFAGGLLVSVLLLGGCGPGRIVEVRDSKQPPPTTVAHRLETIQRQQAELNARMDQLATELQVLTGRFEESRYQSEQTQKRLAAVREELGLSIRELAAQVARIKNRVPSQGGRQTPLGPTPPSSGTSTGSLSVEETYKAAYDTLREGQHPRAQALFKAFLKQYPKTDLSDNAQYWLGESYYAQRDYENAILAFEEVLRQYPKSDKAPSALLKQAFAFQAIGDKANAKILLRKLIAQYPKSEEAKLAKRRLRSLR